MRVVLSLFRGVMNVPESMRDVTEAVAQAYGLTVDQLRDPRWVRGIIGTARQEAMARCYALGKSNAQVAIYFHRADHTCVIHARKRFAAREEAARQERAA